MRHVRILGQGVWYEVRTGSNNREPLFRRAKALRMFAGVFRQTMLRFAFEIRGLRIENDRLRFYIRPADGLELPRIMQWMKQVFAQRYNAAAGRTGHIWGDRYWSRIVEDGEVGGEAATGDRALGRESGNGVCPRGREKEGTPWFFRFFPIPIPPAPE
jgi:putative transposase